MKNQASVVVVGAGCVGLSVAWHLAQLGWEDVVVVDQGEMPAPGGSSSHAPGGMFQTNPARFMTEAAQYSVHFYANLRDGDGKPCAELTGGLELAQTPARLQEIRRRCAFGRAFGLQSEIITPAECGDILPHLNPREVLAGLFVPDDGSIRMVPSMQALAEKAAQTGAVEICDKTTVVGILTSENKRGERRVVGVRTDKGEIKTERVVCCAGIWGPKIARMVGLTFPFLPLSHPYAVSRPVGALAECAKAKGEISFPITRAQDHDLYFRARWDKCGVGSYRHRPNPVDAHDLLPPDKARVMPSLVDWRPEMMAESWRQARVLFPDLGGLEEASECINGVFSFTADGHSILGESLALRGFWAAEAVWLTHGPGVGRIVAEWMHSGEPQTDCHAADINRFHPNQFAPDYIRRRSLRTYIEIYDVLHPKVQPGECRETRRSPMHERHCEAGAEFFEAGGMERPQWYGENRALLRPLETPERDEWSGRHWSPIEDAEARAARAAGAMFDLSAFSVLEVCGAGAAGFLQRLCANDVDVEPGRVVYANLLTDAGGIAADLTVIRTGAERFLIPTGGAAGPRDFAWLAKHHPGDDSVRVADLSGKFAIVGFWGRGALEGVDEVDPGLRELKYFRAGEFFVGGRVPVLAARLSYIGEYGWEFYAPAECGVALWDSLRRIGARRGMIAGGFGAFNALRMEKGMRSYGAELDVRRNPLEAGLGFAVKFDKGEFKGRAALEKVREARVTRKLCTFTVDNGQPLLGLEPVYAEADSANDSASDSGHESDSKTETENKVGAELESESESESGQRCVGYTTSADFGPNVGKSIGMAYLPVALAEPGTRLEVDYLGTRLGAEVAEDVLFDPKGERLRGKY